VFTPMVMIVDNWKWCTGSASTRGGRPPQGEAFCTPENANAYVRFPGRVLVKP
jgi:hypothetical protein